MSRALVKIPRRSLAAQGLSLPPIKGERQEARGNGQNLPMQIIRQEAAPRWLMPGLAQMTPAYVETILRGGLLGNHYWQWQLFALMEDTWPRLVKNANEIKTAAIAEFFERFELRAFDEEDGAGASALERQKLVKSALNGLRPRADEDENGSRGTYYDILDAWLKGVSVVEVLWDQRPGDGGGPLIAPRATAWVHPKNYAWSSEGWIGLLPTNQRETYSPAQNVERFPEDQFLIAVRKARTGHPLGGALLRALGWAWAASNFAEAWFLDFAQVFGQPIRWANYDPNMPLGDRQVLAQMLEQMGSQAWAMFPAGTVLDLKEAIQNARENPQKVLLDYADTICDLLLLGQTLTTQVSREGGSRALGEVHADVRDDMIEAAANFLAEVVNEQFIPAILRLNYGDAAEAPQFVREDVKDQKAEADRDVLLLDRRIEFPKKWAYERWGIPLPQAGEETIGAPARGNGQEPGRVANPESRIPNTDQPAAEAADASGKLADRVLENLTGVEAKWLGGAKPYFTRLIEAAKDDQLTDTQFVEILARAQRQIPDLLRHLDTKLVAAELEASMGAACVNGAIRGALKRGQGRAVAA